MASRSKNILVLLFFLFVTGTQAARAFTVQPVLAAEQKDDGIRRSQEHPNAEAVTYQLVFSGSCYMPLAKFASRSEMQAALLQELPAILQLAVYHKQSSLLAKDYLLHIYPSHNFW